MKGIEGDQGVFGWKGKEKKKKREREREGGWKTREGKRRREFGSDIDVEGSAAFAFLLFICLFK